MNTDGWTGHFLIICNPSTCWMRWTCTLMTNTSKKNFITQGLKWSGKDFYLAIKERNIYTQQAYYDSIILSIHKRKFTNTCMIINTDISVVDCI